MSRNNNNIKSLEDVDNALKEGRSRAKSGLKFAELNADKKPFALFKKDTLGAAGKEDNKVFGLFVGLFLALIILIVIIFAIRGDNHKETTVESEAETTVEAESEADFTVGDEEVTALINNYFKARLSADSEALAEIFGRQNISSDPKLEERLKAENNWIQGFNNIEIYETDGPRADDKLCLVTYDVDFRRTDAIAPGVSYFFSNRNAKGERVLMESLNKEYIDYASLTLSKPYAAAIISNVDESLREVLDSNSTLALIYNAFETGKIYEEANISTEDEPEVKFFSPEDSILVGDDVLGRIKEENEEAKKEESALNESDGEAPPAESDMDSTEEN